MGKINTATKANRKHLIIDAAAVLFRKNGYRNTGMRSIAEQLGIVAASLYNHISGKDELLHTICFSVAAQYQTQLNEINEQAISPLLKMESIIRFHIDMMLNNFNNVYISNRDWKHLNEDAKAIYLTSRRTYEQQLATILKAGIALKEIANREPEVMVLTILSAIRGIEYWHSNPKQIQANTLINNLVDILIQGIKQL